MTNNELYHHGVKGMRWGIRRYQKANGSRTRAGARRPGDNDGQNKSKKSAAKTALKLGGAAVLTAAAAFGVYKFSEFEKSKAIRDIRDKGRANIDRLAAKEENLARLMFLEPEVTIPKYGHEYKMAMDDTAKARQEMRNQLADVGQSFVKAFMYNHSKR